MYPTLEALYSVRSGDIYVAPELPCAPYGYRLRWWVSDPGGDVGDRDEYTSDLRPDDDEIERRIRDWVRGGDWADAEGNVGALRIAWELEDVDGDRLSAGAVDLDADEVRELMG